MEPQLQTERAHRAYQRIDALLRAYGIHNAAVRAEVCQRILREALANTPEGDALEASGARIALEHIEQATALLRASITETAEPASEAKLYLALQRTRLPQTEPELLFGGRTPTDEELSALTRALALHKTPELRRQSMGAPTLRFEGIEEVASGTTALFERWPYLRSLAKVIGILLMALLVYQFAK